MMKQERLLQIIKGAHITEKTSQLSSLNQLVFKVDRTASKAEIREAVESLLEVKVMSVNVVNVKGKTKRFGMRMGRRKDYKKAYISLDKSVDIEALLSEQA